MTHRSHHRATALPTHDNRVGRRIAEVNSPQPRTCRVCHVELEPGERGTCTDCARDLAMERRDWGFPA